MRRILPYKTQAALIILFLCAFPFATVTLADPGPISNGLTISATVPGGMVAAPTVVTSAASGVTTTGVTMNGSISSDGGDTVTAEGFEYGLTTGYGSVSSSSGTFAPGTFSTSISGLVCATSYDYRAYATNSGGSGYGSDQVFTTAACPVAVPPVISVGGGSGSGGHAPLATSSTINFTGTAYPGGTVTILRDGVTIASVIAGVDGSFISSITGVAAGSYVFSIYSQDLTGTISSSNSFPFVIDGKSVVAIGGILAAPTIHVDKFLVQKGDTLTVSGYAEANSLVSITSKQFSQIYTTKTDANGQYSYALDAGTFATGVYTLHATAMVNGIQTPQSRGSIFLVGLSNTTQNTLPGTGNGTCREGDLNCDGKVNIVDYTIMRYWYKKANPPAAVDLSHDGQINLTDFSILASDWTG